MPKLTKRIIDGIEPSAKDAIHWDTELKGLGLRVTKIGVKSYVLQYRNKSGVDRRMTLGRHGVLTVDQARDEAIKHLAAVARGEDPLEQQRTDKVDMTVAELCKEYFKQPVIMSRRGTVKKKSSLDTDNSNVERHIKPLLGTKRLRDLKRTHIEKFQLDVAAGKTKDDFKSEKKRGRVMVDGGKGTAARSLAVFSTILSYAVSKGYLPENPARGVKPFQGEKKERFLSNAEFIALGEKLAALEAKEKVNKVAINAIRFLMLTGCRRGEALNLKWQHIDFDRGMLRLPDSKTGAKVIPIGDPAVELLQTTPRNEESEYVFWSSRGEGPIVDLSRLWATVTEAAEFKGLRLHDLRHSYASAGVTGGESLFIIGKILGHKQTRTTEIYAHLADDPLRAAANRTSEAISALLKPQEKI